MKRVANIFFIFLIAINVALSSWYVLHGDIVFTADIARDFWLLEELDQKKLVLIGPRSSGDLYHGPLWSYINYPSYVIGGGDPVIVGWWWVALAILATVASYTIATRLFGKFVGILYAIMVSLYLSFHTRGFSHPHGAMLLVPVWFFFFVRYVQKRHITNLAVHIVLSGMLIQFELAVGLPLTILSAVALVATIIKQGNYNHFLSFLLYPLTLVNFILFDFRHGHILLSKVLSFITPQTDVGLFNYTQYVGNRIFLFFTSTEILRRDPGGRNIILFIVMLIFIAVQTRHHKYKEIYFSFLYIYTGFFVLSFIDKGPILYFHLYPLFLLVFLMFCSLATSKYKKVFLILFALIYVLNISSAIGDARAFSGFSGQNKASWKSLSDIARTVYEDAPAEFGYFVYAPDVMAYEPKYAMRYMGKLYSTINAYSFKKLPVTYLVIQPPPHGNPYMKDEWWRINQVGITKEPEDVVTFANGYKIERYSLTEAQQKVSFDPAIDPGLHFR